MEEEKILQNILKGEVRQLQDLKNYTAPFEKILRTDSLKNIGKRSTEYEKFCKYACFCMKLLRYCVEALSKGENHGSGNEIQEDCFKCSHLGADMLAKLVTSGVTLLSEISISVIIKLIFHLIFIALKDNQVSHVIHSTTCLVNILRAVRKSQRDNVKDLTGLCKQISDRLWNAAIKLPTSMDKHEKALLALSLRENSIDLLIVAKLDVSLTIERGLQTGRQFQVEVTGCSERDEGQKFLLSFLSKVVTLLDCKLEESLQMISRLEDLCITCCKFTSTPSHVHELLRSFKCLISTDVENNSTFQAKFSIFQSIVQILLCALCFRLKEEKELVNHKYDINLKWSMIQKRLASTSEGLRNLDSNLYAESQIILAINYMGSIFSESFKITVAEKNSVNFVKFRAEFLSVVTDLLLVCYNIQSHVAKSKSTSGAHISAYNTWEIIVQPKLVMLYLISCVVFKTLNTEMPKTLQNGRTTATKHDYVDIMQEGKNILDGIVKEVPAALEQYIHYACHAYNIGLMLSNCGQISEATSLARLSCQAASKWYLAKSCESNAITKVALYKKYELLSDCLEKQGHWLESVRAMTLCCQYYVMSVGNLATGTETAEKASRYVMTWLERKHKALKQLSDEKELHKVQSCNWKASNGPNLNKEQIFMLRKMELECSKKRSYCTSSDYFYVVEKLFTLYSEFKDETNAITLKLEKLKTMYHMVAEDATPNLSDMLHICEDLITDITEILHEDQESIMVKGILASAFFWKFLLQYSIAVEQMKKETKEINTEFIEDEEPASSNFTNDFEKDGSLNLTPDFVLSLHSAVNLWTELVTEAVKTNKKLDVDCQSETRRMLQISSSVYGFLNMPLMRIHILLVLSTFVRHCEGNENLQTVVVANSLAMQVFCEEGNVPCAELLGNDCEDIMSKLGEDCQANTRCLFYLARSQLFLCKGLYDDGWQIVKSVVDELDGCEKSRTDCMLLAKAKLLCARYLSLPASLCNTSFRDADRSNYFEYVLESSKLTEALVDKVVNNGGRDEFVCLDNHRKERAVLLSHWSLLGELCCCFVEIGKVYLLQGATKEAQRYLQDGREIARRFLSAKRYLHFTLQLAEVNIVLNETRECKAHLEDAIRTIKPDLSLSDIVDKKKPFNLENDGEDCLFNDYDNISTAQLEIKLVNCYCQYLKLTGNVCNSGKAISLSHDLRQSSVEGYKRSLDSLERIFAITFNSKLYQSVEVGEPLHNTEKRNGKVKGKRGKTTAKRSESETSSEFIPCKADIASLAFLENCLKTYSLDGDNALKEGNYPRLLSDVKAGLDMVQWAQGILKDPFLLDLMSTSLLHYLQGVAHMLASKDGFDSWRVAGCHLLPAGTEEADVADMSEVISRLDLSPSPDEAMTRKSRRGVKHDKREEFCDDSMEKNFFSGQSSPEESKIKKRSQSRQKVTFEPSSLARSKRTASSRKAVHDIPQTPLSSQVVFEDFPSGMKLGKNTHSCRKNTKSENALSKRLVKPRRNTKRNLLCENAETEETRCEGNVEENKSTKMRSCRKSKKSSCDLIEQCHKKYEEFHVRHSMEPIGEKDKDMANALDSFNSSLTFLHPCYNPILLSRICDAYVLCYGLTCPDKAAAYLNMAMATTLRHQATHRSAQKIRKESDEQVKNAKEQNKEDQMLRIFETLTIDKEERKSRNQLLHLQTIKNAIAFKTLEEEVMESFKTAIDLLPDDLTVCTVSVVQAPDRENVKYLVIARLRKNYESLVLKLTLPNDEEGDYQTNGSVVRDLSTVFGRNIVSDFTELLRKNNENCKLSDIRQWQTGREYFDDKLKRLLKRLEDTWFGRWRGILNGRCLDEESRSRLHSNVEEIQKIALQLLGRRVQNEQLLEVLVDSFWHLKAAEVMQALAELTGMQINCEQLIKFSKSLPNILNNNVRDDNTACATRGPVVLILHKAITNLPFESMPILRGQEVSRMPSLEFITAHLTFKKTTMSGVDTQQTYYVLNPNDDLPYTEKRFSDWFLSEEAWKGVIGRPPSTTEFKEGLRNHELFLYLGHGNGRQFLKGHEIKKLYCQAVAMLMGCSSGRLIVNGQCDARGMVLNYLLSGSPVVVGNLWDVTDRDIDIFTNSVLRMWFKEGDKLSLTQCIVQSRNNCLMKYVNGAAPVVYGMPVYTRTTK